MKLAGVDAGSLHRRLAYIVQQNGLGAMFPDSRLETVAQEVAQKDLQALALRWRLDFKVGFL